MFAPPTYRSTTASPFASRTSVIGSAGIGYFFRNAALALFSVFTLSQTNRPAYRSREASV
jgi:hypothetical protein